MKFLYYTLLISVFDFSSLDLTSESTSWIISKLSSKVLSCEAQVIKFFNSSLDLLPSSLTSIESTKYWGIYFNSSSLISGTMSLLYI